MRGRNEFRKLGQWMIGTGVLVGLVFPPFMVILGVSTEIALRPVVFGATIACGVALGAFNIFLARIVVGRRITAMQVVLADLAEERTVQTIPCADNSDAFGEMARAISVFKEHAHARQLMDAQRADDQRRADQAKTEEREALAFDFEAVVKTAMQGAQKDTHALQDAARVMGESAESSINQANTAVDLSEAAASGVGAVARAAEEMAENVRALSERMRRSNAMSEDAVERVRQTDAMMDELGRATHGIESVAGLIIEIAEQTNMLALNATIEAARAGDAGKGFAVVAGEVKNLANQTAKATDEITQHIDNIRDAGQSARVAMEKVSQSISEMNAIAGEVTRAADAQTATIADISANARDTADATGQSVGLIRQVGEAIEQTGLAAHEMLATVDDLARQMRNLQERSDSFATKVREG